jgi:DUF1680 family protein
LGRYIYTYNQETVYVHQFISSKAEFEISGAKVLVKQSSEYPWNGDIKLQLEMSQNTAFKFAIRIPGWCKQASLTVDGVEMAIDELEHDGYSKQEGHNKPKSYIVQEGYIIINREFRNGSEIHLHLVMPVILMQANIQVRADQGKVAIQRGPVVYCIEEADNGNNIFDISLAADSEMEAVFEDNLLSGAVTIKATGFRRKENGYSKEVLYSPYTGEREKVSVKAVPYCMWGNREPGEMEVWIRI